MTQENPYSTAGWMAIAAGILSLPLIVLGLILDTMSHRTGDQFASVVFLSIYGFIAFLQLCFGIYAFLRFRHLLNHRFDFHQVDALITAIICGVIAITLVAVVGRSSLAIIGYVRPLAVFFIVMLVTVGLPLNVLSIVYSVRLLRLEDDLRGLKKPYAYTNIAAAVCFATLILAPVALVIQAVCSILLGAIFLKPAPKVEELEFV